MGVYSHFSSGPNGQPDPKAAFDYLKSMCDTAIEESDEESYEVEWIGASIEKDIGFSRRVPLSA